MSIVINVAVIPDTKTNSVLAVLEKEFDSINWKGVDDVIEADLVMSFGTKKGPKLKPTLHLRSDAGGVEMVGALNDAIRKHIIILPTELGREVLLGKIHDSVSKLKKLRDNSALILKGDEVIDDGYVSAKEKLAVRLLHGTAMKRFAPDLEEVLSGRTFRTLQRRVPSWCPLVPMTPDPDINEMYPVLPANGSELRDRLEKVRSRLEELGVTPSLSLLDYSQLNLGIPTPGGMHRESENLLDPDSDLEFYMRRAARFMLRGLADAYKEGEESFRAMNTRVGVKIDNYQGPILNTKSHPVRQTLWSIMTENDNNIFYFSDLFAVSASGFRSQSNGAGKKRPSYVLVGENEVGKSRAIDSDDIKGALVAVYPDRKTAEILFEPDGGEIGGRKRIVANVESAKNDSLLPIPSYLADTKDKLYKYLYQQDLEILGRFVSESREFENFWRDGYTNWEFLRTQVKKNFGISDVESFINYIMVVGQMVLCGDVVQYDASATWNFVKPFNEELMSAQALAVAEQVYNADKIGVYTDHRGIKRYYYVTCSTDDSFPEHYNKLVSKTRDAMSSLPSGLAITAQEGRGPVRAVLDHIAERMLISHGFGIDQAREIVTWEPPYGGDEVFSFSTAYMNDGGDDHNLGMLIFHLISGKEMRECKKDLYEIFDNYEFLKLLPEEPKMNCGYKFHDDENERCIAISLSEGRMIDNTIYPEYPRSALGLDSSINNYIQSAVGSPIEDTMLELGTIIACDIYGFDSLEHLSIVAAAEDHYLANNQSSAPARQRIAQILGIPENDLEWSYSLQELVDLGIDEDLLDMYRKPIPAALTQDPSKFFNLNTIKDMVK